MAFQPTPFLLQKTQDRQVDDLQRTPAGAIAQLQGLAPLNGVYIASQPDATGTVAPIVFLPNIPVTIQHNLGRPYVGWVLMRPRNYVLFTGTGGPAVFEIPNADPGLDASQLTLVHLGTRIFTADAWVY